MWFIGVSTKCYCHKKLFSSLLWNSCNKMNYFFLYVLQNVKKWYECWSFKVFVVVVLFVFFLFETGKDTQKGHIRNIFNSLISFSKLPQQLRPGWPKPGAQKSIWIHHLGFKHPGTKDITCWLPGSTLPGSWVRSSATESRHSNSLWTAQVLSYYIKHLPKAHFLMKIICVTSPTS